MMPYYNKNDKMDSLFTLGFTLFYFDQSTRQASWQLHLAL